MRPFTKIILILAAISVVHDIANKAIRAYENKNK